MLHQKGSEKPCCLKCIPMPKDRDWLQETVLAVLGGFVNKKNGKIKTKKKKKMDIRGRPYGYLALSLNCE